MDERIFDKEFYSKLGWMQLSSKLKLHGGMSGNRRSTAKGSSVEYSDFREYIWGDDVRRIDWNAYARMDKWFVKLFVEEKEAYYHLCVDASASMDYGEAKKSRTALQLAGLFAHMALSQMDRVALVALTESGMERYGPLTGAPSFPKALEWLSRVSFQGRTMLRDCVRQIPYRGKGISIILSDFMDGGEPEEWMKYLLYQKQEVVLVHVLAGEEWEPDFEGDHHLIDMETGEEMRVSLNAKVRRSYDKEFGRFQARLRGMCKKYGARYLAVDTREPLDSSLYAVTNSFSV